jgi:GNAT superfamily N-acetyltransferase
VTTPELRFRRATSADSRACFDVFMPAIRDLTARQGAPWQPDSEKLWSRLQPMYDHLGRHAAEWWVAEDADGRLAGYARSVERGGLFELSEFFVDPERQSAGVGKRLLELAFPLGRGDVRAIIATTDVRALRRYHAAGTFARFPICALEAAPSADAPLDPAVELVRAGAEEISALRRIEAQVLEFDRGEDDFAWLLGDREGWLYRRDGGDIGFAFVGKRGVGPIAALDPADQVPILWHVEARAAALGREEIGFEVPMVNEVAMRHLLGRGFRMDSFFTFLLSSRPFGQFDRFIGFAPPFVL